MSELLPNSTRPNHLRVALILPNERAFYSDGTGNPQLFTGVPGTIKRGRKSEPEPISHESLSDRVLRDPAYGFRPTKALRSLPAIEGVHSYVRTPVLGLSSFDEDVNTNATRLYDFDTVVRTAERRRNFIDPVDLLILTEAFENYVRRRRVL